MNYQRELLSGNIDGDVNGCDEALVVHAPKVIEHINNVRNTIYLLEKHFDISQCLEVEQWSRFHEMKINNEKLSYNLKEVEQRNMKMLNLFRANVTNELPNGLKNQVKRSWQQKYDALLNLNSQLRREIHLKNIIIKEKNYEVAVLQQQLLNIGEKLTERDEAIKDIFQKYLTLKINKDEEEVYLRKYVETLQDPSMMMKKNNTNMSLEMSHMSLMPTKEALLAYQTRKGERLIRENDLLRASLQQLRINCKCNYSSDEVSCVSNSP